MKRKCDICRQLEELCYTFEYDHYVFGWQLNFCKKCGDVLWLKVCQLSKDALKEILESG